jgi:hypothetical protein
MARWTKPKVRRKVEHGARCDFCGVEIEGDVGAYFATHRPCLLPGHEALAMIAGDEPSRYVVWGKTIGVVCPACGDEVEAYMAKVDALMRSNDEVVEHPQLFAQAPPLTPEEIEGMVLAAAGGDRISITLTEGRLYPPVERNG